MGSLGCRNDWISLPWALNSKACLRSRVVKGQCCDQIRWPGHLSRQCHRITVAEPCRSMLKSAPCPCCCWCWLAQARVSLLHSPFRPDFQQHVGSTAKVLLTASCFSSDLEGQNVLRHTFMILSCSLRHVPSSSEMQVTSRNLCRGAIHKR